MQQGDSYWEHGQASLLIQDTRILELQTWQTVGDYSLDSSCDSNIICYIQTCDSSGTWWRAFRPVVQDDIDLDGSTKIWVYDWSRGRMCLMMNAFIGRIWCKQLICSCGWNLHFGIPLTWKIAEGKKGFIQHACNCNCPFYTIMIGNSFNIQEVLRPPQPGRPSSQKTCDVLRHCAKLLSKGVRFLAVGARSAF